MHLAGSYHVEKLTEGYYESWRMQMKSVLIFNDLSRYVDGSITRPTSGNEETQWKIKDEKALALVTLSISKNARTHSTNDDSESSMGRINSSTQFLKSCKESYIISRII